MKTIRLLYPDWLSGGLETYYFGANLLQHILPANPKQPLVKVNIAAPDGLERTVQDGITGKKEVFAGILAAQKVIAENQPQKLLRLVVTVSSPKLRLITCTAFTLMQGSSGLMPTPTSL